MLYLSSILKSYLNSSSCCVLVEIHVVFEYNCLLYYTVNVCDSTPCKNGGTCSISGRSYMCSCRDGFSGNQCQGTVNTYLIMCFECKFEKKGKRSGLRIICLRKFVPLLLPRWTCKSNFKRANWQCFNHIRIGKQ